jgi:3-dehydroquinate dehydratase/shikimate dehydrogenase
MSPDNTARVCVPVCEKSLSALKEACQKASVVADMVELRLDCLNATEFATAAANIESLVSSLSCPAIVTFRAAEQGGRRTVSDDERRVFWGTQANDSAAALFDIEGDLFRGFTFQIDRSRMICSHHDFVGVPENLEQIYEELAATSARVIKIAVQASDITDCVPVFQLLARAGRESREVIALAMGDSGIATRILGPSRGALLTYGALADENSTAPGQLTVSQLRSLYRIQKIDEETLICGLVGQPVAHSVSPHMHNAAFERQGVNGVYIPFEVQDLHGFFKRMVHPGSREIDWKLRGLSITAPHKTNVMAFLDWIEPRAKEIGAVNTVVVKDDRLLGYNTDAEGLLEPLIRKTGSLAGLRVAVIGAGGAASAAVWALRMKKANVALFARNLEKGNQLSQRFDVSCNELGTASFAGYDVVINATPLGSLGKLVDQTPATAQQLSGARLAFDLIYNPSDTRFLQEARDSGCKTLGGLEMLVAQAALQFRLWTNKTADSSAMHSAALSKLKQSLPSSS